MKYAKITAVGAYLPKQVLTNTDLEKIMDTSDAWISERTGIKQRHKIADNETVTSMGIAACNDLLTKIDIDVNEIDLIIGATGTPDRIFPAMATRIQQALNITNECMAFDISAACAGFIFALSVANKYISTGAAKHALIVCSEAMTRVLDWDDRATAVIFGDGAAAVLLSASDTAGIISTHEHSDGKYADLIGHFYPQMAEQGVKLNPYVQMEGNKVFRRAVAKLGDIVTETLEKNKLDSSVVDWLVPHQANYRIIEATAKKLKLSMDRVICTVALHANTSSASIPLALNDGIESGKIKRGEVLLFESFGAGLSWGSALVKY